MNFKITITEIQVLFFKIMRFFPTILTFFFKNFGSMTYSYDQVQTRFFENLHFNNI